MANVLRDWKWSGNNVQTAIVDGEHLSAESALILAAPPRLEQLSLREAQIAQGNTVGANVTPEAHSQLVPIGLLQDFTVGQTKPQQEIFEIGSRLRYFVDGRMRASFQVSRIMYFGPSLMRLLYAYVPASKISRFAQQLNAGTLDNDALAGLDQFPEIEDFDAPGYGNNAGFGIDQNALVQNSIDNNRDFWINLLSLVFNQPTGLVVILKGANNRAYGSFYMESVKVENHGFNVSSGAVIISETLSGQFKRVIPIRVQQFSLTGG